MLRTPRLDSAGWSHPRGSEAASGDAAPLPADAVAKPPHPTIDGFDAKAPLLSGRERYQRALAQVDGILKGTVFDPDARHLHRLPFDPRQLETLNGALDLLDRAEANLREVVAWAEAQPAKTQDTKALLKRLEAERAATARIEALLAARRVAVETANAEHDQSMAEQATATSHFVEVEAPARLEAIQAQHETEMQALRQRNAAAKAARDAALAAARGRSSRMQPAPEPPQSLPEDLSSGAEG